MYMSVNKNVLSKISTVGSVVALSVVSLAGVVSANAQSYTDSGNVDLQVDAGVLTVTVEGCTMVLDAGTNPVVSSSDQDVFCKTDTLANAPIATFEDLRGDSTVGWFATATMTNFEGASDGTILALCRDVGSGNDCPTYPDFDLTPGPMRIQAGQPPQVTLNGLITTTTTQSTASGITDGTATGVNSTAFDIGGFTAGDGEGAYEKDLNLHQVIPAYTRAQQYNATLTVSAS